MSQFFKFTVIVYRHTFSASPTMVAVKAMKSDVYAESDFIGAVLAFITETILKYELGKRLNCLNCQDFFVCAALRTFNVQFSYIVHSNSLIVLWIYIHTYVKYFISGNKICVSIITIYAEGIGCLYNILDET